MSCLHSECHCRVQKNKDDLLEAARRPNADVLGMEVEGCSHTLLPQNQGECYRRRVLPKACTL